MTFDRSNEIFRIQGAKPLRGRVRVDGSKNAALPILAASLAVDGTVQLRQIPDLTDIDTMCQLLSQLGAHICRDTAAGTVEIRNSAQESMEAPYDLVSRMRASVCVLGPLLSRFGRARVSLPGGCNIGHRPIDLHLRGLAALGADIRIERGYIIAESRILKGCDLVLSGPEGSTVTGTCNVLCAAATAVGRTVIRAAACEPEVEDLAAFLNAAGADIQGAGTSTIEVTGVRHLNAVAHSVIPDRIEAATLAIAAAITSGDVEIINAPTESLQSIRTALDQIGVCQSVINSDVEVTWRVSAEAAGELRPVELIALPYPGIPTDAQAQLMALLSLAGGTSVITDRVFPDRFMHAAELVRMGADIRVTAGTAIIRGVDRLTGATVMASDLRASAALVLAAMAAEGTSEIRRVYHIDRGYAGFERKLNQLGACIQRLSGPNPD
ncbi:MAG: UDP-N-acetylglucosamine 1-carboxyvinyltransferase [Planctomycetaceae bacterium]|nr:UDP-N-acetylglucosamine 1-carboxyvinyltransferase [Planctomycetaceae bacterium]